MVNLKYLCCLGSRVKENKREETEIEIESASEEENQPRLGGVVETTSKVVNVQQWLEVQEEYNTKEKRIGVTELNIKDKSIRNKKLKGGLNLNDFFNLKKLNCNKNYLTILDLTKCERLEKLYCWDNKITSLSLSNYCPNLTELDIRNNNFPESDLSVFSLFTNLEVLRIGNVSEKSIFFNDIGLKVEQNIYNRFSGSLEPLKNLTKLRELDISNTDINSGYEHLPASIKKISYSSKEIPNSKIKEIAEQLSWIGKRLNGKQVKEWIEFESSDYDFVAYLNEKGYKPQPALNLEKLREEYDKSVQSWLDKRYPWENRSEVREIYLNEPNLEGELNLADFINSEWIYISYQVNETRLIIKNSPENKGVIKLINAQEYINQQYPTKQDRRKVSELNIRSENLEGNLNLSDFTNLRKLDCNWNQLTSLNVINCSHLAELYCLDNLLTTLTLPTNLTNLKRLNLSNNNFPSQDLSFLINANNLESLWLGSNVLHDGNQERINRGIYNRFTGSLDFLSGMEKLKTLDISHTDLNEVDLDKLPNNLKEIVCYINERPNSKLTQIIPQLKKYNECGRCQKCRQINTSRGWCQYCMEQEWQTNIKQLTGQEVIEKFVQQQPQKPAWTYHQHGEEKLKWIPPEKFADIEYLAEGGFSKIYRAKWKKEGEYYPLDVVLKVLNNSQNITLDFLAEITNTKLVDGINSHVITFYGISQDPTTKDYMMIMQYMDEGNLREHLQQKDNTLTKQYLQKNYPEKLEQYFYEKKKNNKLNFKDKFWKFMNIIEGLKSIHDQGLIHKDFHMGNILNNDDKCYITDLGLSRHASFQPKEGKIYGVMPYVAPELLKGQSHTQASDIYSFGIIAYELFANSYPYPRLDSMYLATKVIQGLRPNLEETKLPQLLKNLIKRCWDDDPTKRPISEELNEIISNWWSEIYDSKDTKFTRQVEEIETEYNHFSQNIPYQIYPTAVLCSKPINTKQIIELLENPKTEKNSLQLTKINEQIKEMEKKIEGLKKSLDSGEAELVNKFIEVKKQSLKDKENEEAENSAWDLEDELEGKELVAEKDEIIRCCEDLVKLEQQKQEMEKKQNQLQTQIEVSPKQ